LPRIGFISIPSDDVKKCQQAFLALLLGIGFISIPSNDVKKCQQTLAYLLTTASTMHYVCDVMLGGGLFVSG
jgi:hypothetical protein